jgi:hypothetical protein
MSARRMTPRVRQPAEIIWPGLLLIGGYREGLVPVVLGELCELPLPVLTAVLVRCQT